jgi:cell division protein FtsB
MSTAAIKFDRTLPVWGIITGLAVLGSTGAGVVWNLAGIAHDVSEVKSTLVAIQAHEDSRDARVTALEARVVKLEASVDFLEKPRL